MIRIPLLLLLKIRNTNNRLIQMQYVRYITRELGFYCFHITEFSLDKKNIKCRQLYFIWRELKHNSC